MVCFQNLGLERQSTQVTKMWGLLAQGRGRGSVIDSSNINVLQWINETLKFKIISEVNREGYRCLSINDLSFSFPLSLHFCFMPHVMKAACLFFLVVFPQANEQALHSYIPCVLTVDSQAIEMNYRFVSGFIF